MPPILIYLLLIIGISMEKANLLKFSLIGIDDIEGLSIFHSLLKPRK
jgi:hypothetical protein